jgi:hypothetical protein
MSPGDNIVSESIHTKRRAWPVVVKGIGAFLFILLAVVLILQHTGAMKLAQAIQEARAMGGPVTLDEVLAARPSYPPGQNGADIILALTPAVDALTPYPQDAPIVGECDDLPLGVHWPSHTHDSARLVLAKADAALKQLDQIADCQGGAFPAAATANPIDMVGAQMPHMGLVRECVRLKSLQTIARVMDGNTQHLADDVDVLLRQADYVNREPLVLGWLTGIACEALTVSIVEQACAVEQVNPAVLAQIEPLLAQAETSNAMADAMRGERAYFMAETQYASTWAPSRLFQLLSGWMSRDEAAGIRLYNQLIRGIETGQALETTRAIDAQAAAMSPLYVLTRINMQSNLQPIRLGFRTIAQHRAARTALAAERFRQATGRFPSRLDELVPTYIAAIPADPFAPAQSLKLTTRPDRWIVYSVGEDETDNGGNVEFDRINKSGPTDFGFTLLALEARNRPAPPDEPETQPASQPATSAQ